MSLSHEDYTTLHAPSKEAIDAAKRIYVEAIFVNRKASGRHKSYALPGHAAFYYGKAAVIIQSVIDKAKLTVSEPRALGGGKLSGDLSQVTPEADAKRFIELDATMMMKWFYDGRELAHCFEIRRDKKRKQWFAECKERNIHVHGDSLREVYHLCDMICKGSVPGSGTKRDAARVDDGSKPKTEKVRDKSPF